MSIRGTGVEIPIFQAVRYYFVAHAVFVYWAL